MALTACTTGESYVSVGDGGDAPSLDARVADALDAGDSIAADAGEDGMDAAQRDSGADPSDPYASLDLPDGSVILADGAIELPDGEVLDLGTAIMRFGEGVDAQQCSVSSEDAFEVATEAQTEGGFALVPGYDTGFGLVYRAKATGSCSRNIGLLAPPSEGPFLEPRALLPDCRATLDVAMHPTPDGFRVAWIDNATQTAELHVIELTGNLSPRAAFARDTVTHSARELELRPAFAEIGGETLLTWIVEDSELDARAIRGRVVSRPGAQSFDLVPAVAGQMPQELAVSELGDGERGALAWVGPQADPGVWLQALDSEGQPSGDAVKLTERVGASSSVDLSPWRDGGAIVYSIEIDGVPQVRFMRLDGAGAPRGEERILVDRSLPVRDASIAPIGGGYVVAYRQLLGEPPSSAEIRLMFVTKEGNVPRDAAGRPISFLVAPSTLASGRTDVELSIDGYLMIAWLDADPSAGGSVLKTVRRRLDCQ